jgi:hypothetical protein
MPTPLVSLGRPSLPTSEADLHRWQPWAAAVLGALATLGDPLHRRLGRVTRAPPAAGRQRERFLAAER